MGQLSDLKFRFRTGAIRKNGVACVLAIDFDLGNEQLPHTAFCLWQEQRWKGFQPSKWNGSSICFSALPKTQSVSLGEYGNVRVLGGGDDIEESILDPKRPELSQFREVRTIGGYAYACGMDRQVYRRDAPGQWICLDMDIGKLPATDPYVFGFESIHGFDQNDIYAVGWHGEIWHFNGQEWQQIDSPVTALLSRVLCAPDGKVYICGSGGLLLRGRKDVWEIVEQENSADDLWDIEWFKGKLYLSSLHALFTLEGDELALVDTGDETPGTCYHLDAADGILWSIGAEDILEFNGETWKRIE